MAGATALYIGQPGTVLWSLPCPGQGMDKSPDKFGQVAQLLGGGYGVDFAAQSVRQWKMTFPFDDTAWHTLHALYTWQYGPGPFALLEPSITNYLAPNQASGTDSRASTTGFSITGGANESIASSKTLAYTGSRSLRWSLPSSISSGVLVLTAPFSYVGFPTPTTLQWTFSAQLRGGSNDPTPDVTMGLRWYDSSGALLSTSSGSPVTLSSGAWAQATVIATAPANAVYLSPIVSVNPASVSDVSYVYFDQAQLQIGGSATTWRPGESLPIVSFATAPQEVVAWATTGALGERRQIAVSFAQMGVV